MGLRLQLPVATLVLLLAGTASAPLHTPPPIEPIRTWVAVGSWYGPGFHGRVTANGEIYNMYAPTAAHITLPMGSMVRVTNPRNGKSQVVRINDRGPYIEGREIDLSYATAQHLGIGVGRVRIELLKVPPRRAKAQQPQPPDSSTGL